MEEDEQTPLPKKQKRSPKTSTPISAATNSNPLSTFSSIAASLKTSKLLKVEPFNLFKDDPGLWIASFEKALENHGSIEDIAFPTLFHLLDDVCQSWHFRYRRQNKIIIWSELKDDFIEYMQKRFVKKLGELKKQYDNKESVEKYVQDQVDIHKAFFPKLTEKELILAAIAGLPDTLKLDLNEYKDVKLSVFLSFCNFVDKSNQAARQDDNSDQI